MKGCDKPRAFQYSSLVMGSKDLPLVSFPSKKPSALISAKVFSKKTDILNAKYSKMKYHKIRTRNERPDIFLEGEQLARNNAAWVQQDVQYFESIRHSIRKSTPNAFVKNYQSRGRNLLARGMPLEADFEEETSCAYILNYPRRTTTTMSKPQTSSNRRIYSSERQPTTSKDESTKRQLHNKIEQKLMQKTELRLTEATKEGEPFKRKQLFYMSQKDFTFIKSESFIVVEHPSGQVVTGNYSKKVVEIASLTKIMTFYAVVQVLKMKEIDPEQQVVTVDQKAAEISGTSAELYEGDQYTIAQLLYGLMLPSGNDAAVALARWGGSLLGGDAKQFMALMNKLAGDLGMKSSCFGNPHGLPHPQNGSTAEDVSMLVMKCLEIERFREVVKCKSYKCWTENHGVRREVLWENTNKLLRRPGFQGIKTGVTVAAGPCLASLFTADDRTFIVILLRTNKMSRRFKETRWLLRICLRRMNFNGRFSSAIAELGREDAEQDSDNSEEEEQFMFDRNDLVQLEKRRRILINDL